jgi:hypothetical protein
MKKVKRIGILLLLLIFSCNTEIKEKAKKYEKNPDVIQIVMFHLSQRCESCNALEKETMTILEKAYRKELTKEDIRFLSFDIRSENGKAAAKQLNASGLSLFIVKGDSISDLTSSAFLLAHTQPERYHAILSNELKKFLK